MTGRKPFGYFHGEAEIIVRIKALRAAGWGFDSIADCLNANEVPSRSRKSWHGIVINRILARAVREIDQPLGETLSTLSRFAVAKGARISNPTTNPTNRAG